MPTPFASASIMARQADRVGIFFGYFASFEVNSMKQLSLSLVVSLCLASAAHAEVVAHFPLDENGDSTVGGFVADTTNNVTFGGAGANANTGTSASFDGASSVIQHDWDSQLNPESFTLTLWAKSNGGAGAWNSPVTSRHDLFNEGETSQGYLIYDNNPSGVWTFWSGNGPDPGNWQVLDGPAVALDQWQHVAITYDDATEAKTLYVDGAVAATANDSITPNDTTPFNIGAGQDFGDGFWFVGDIDDIGLWNEALSAEQVQAVMSEGVGPFVPEPTVWAHLLVGLSTLLLLRRRAGR